MEEVGWSSFRLPSVLKTRKASVFKAFRTFDRGFQRASVGVFLPKKAYKKDTLHNTECLIVFNVFFPLIRASFEVKSFCTFGLNSGCLITITHLLVGYVGKKCHLASSLDSSSELSLVKSASAGNTSGENLSALGNEFSELNNILVIDLVYFVLAEDANLLSSVHRAERGTLCIVSIH